MIRAIFFDIDGTLMPMGTHEVPEKVQQALYEMKEKGIRLFIASGRPLIQMKQLMPPFIKEFPWDGLVLFNGQYCIDAEGKVVRDQPIDTESLKTLVPWLKENADFSCGFYELEYAYDLKFNEQMYEYLKSIGKEDKMMPIDDPERSYTHDTYQICPYIDEKEDPEFLSHAKGMESARWTPAFADMIPLGGGKPTGMKTMLDYYGLRQEESMAFGDAGNDVTMLKYAHIGVAMGNGTDVAKASADYITTDAADDGIVNALKHFHVL